MLLSNGNSLALASPLLLLSLPGTFMRETMQRFLFCCLFVLAFDMERSLAVEPPADTSPSTETPAANPAGSTEAAPRFDVWEYRVDGNSALDPRVIEKTVYPFLGPAKSIGDVEAARTALEKAYHDAGFGAALVDIPEQDVNEGIVFLKVGEGRVDRLKVTGSRYYSLGRIKSGVPALAQGKALNLNEVQDQLGKLAGESPDRKITPVMRAGKTPGTVEVELAVEDELPLHGSLEMHGKNSANTSRLRLAGMLRYDNLWQRFHSVSLQYQVSPEDYSNLEVWSGTYVMPIDFLDARLVFYGVGLDSLSAISTVGSMGVVGNGNIYGLRLVKPLPSSDQDFSHNVTLGWDYKDFGQITASQSSPVTYSPFYLSYGGNLNYGGGSQTTFNLEADFSIAGLGNEAKEFENKRHGATPDYVYVAGDIRHTQALPGDVRLLGRLAGQVSESRLINNEQFGAGGWQSVRGYHETEQLGDDGVNASLEVYTPDLAPLTFDGFNQLRFLAFADIARLWIHHPLAGTPSRYDLSSAGAGFRLQMFRHVIGELDWAYPFSNSGLVRAGEQRLDFRMAYEF